MHKPSPASILVKSICPGCCGLPPQDIEFIFNEMVDDGRRFSAVSKRGRHRECIRPMPFEQGRLRHTARCLPFVMGEAAR